MALKNMFMSKAKYRWMVAGFALLLPSLWGQPVGQNASLLTANGLPSPAASGGFVPQIARGRNGDIVASWLEPLTGEALAFRMCVRHGKSWSTVRTIASGARLSRFTADLPGVMALSNGKLLAYWEISDTEGGRYATVIQLATSNDDGRTWSKPVKPYRDVLPGQHGFMSSFPMGRNVGLVWLDAQAQSNHAAAGGHEGAKGAIGLRQVTMDTTGRTLSESWIDPVSCECCPTASAVTESGPVVVYRGRLEPPNTKPSEVHPERPTIRDIQIARFENGSWTSPRLVHRDNWIINACPDNGPAVDALGKEVVVAWWTRAGGQAKVQVAFSSDSGTSFGKAIRADLADAEGQVTVTWEPGHKEAVVGWLEDHKVWARTVAPDGKLGTPLALGPSAPHVRLPRWIADSSVIFAAWTGSELGTRSVHFAELKTSSGSLPR